VKVDESLLAVRSDWFLVTIAAQQGDTRARARALLKRSSTSGEWPLVIWQTIE
jgi:type II secretory pathway component PulK